MAPVPTAAQQTVPTRIVEVTAIPDLTQDPVVSGLLSSVGEKLAAISTMRFRLVDEGESGATLLGGTLKSMEVEVEAPSSFSVAAELEAPALGTVQVSMVAVENQAYIRFTDSAPWISTTLDQLPFNFGQVGTNLGDLLPIVREPEISGQESVLGVQTTRVVGTIFSEDLRALLNTLYSGHIIELTLWIDDADHALVQMRLNGQIYDYDPPGARRLLIIEAINAPIEIQLPEVPSDQ